VRHAALRNELKSRRVIRHNGKELHELSIGSDVILTLPRAPTEDEIEAALAAWADRRRGVAPIGREG
jgi:hypothetical protein